MCLKFVFVLQEAIVIVLDVGRSVTTEISPNGETFLHNAQLCATKIIQKKVITFSVIYHKFD